ncbi:MAG: hypothetical protein AAGE84_20755 [Cyanobacteria bacterium P01_G01_bin.39]
MSQDVEVNCCHDQEDNYISNDIDEILNSNRPLSNEKVAHIAAYLWDKTSKPQTLSQLKTARKSAELLINYLDECIQELEEQESLEQQFKRIIGIDIPSRRLSIEEYRKYIHPKFSNWCLEDKQFFVDNFSSILPLNIVGLKKKYL